MAINSPVVDRSTPAFVTSFIANDINDYLRVYFYFQSVTNNNLNTQVVLAQVLEDSSTLFKNNALYEPFVAWADEENLFTIDRYYIEIPVTMLKNGKFTKNSMISIQLMSLSYNIIEIIPAYFQIVQGRIWDRTNDSLWKSIDQGVKLSPSEDTFYHSAWSTPSFMYPLETPVFVTYGGLTAAQVEDKFALTQDAKETTLLSEEVDNKLDVHGRYYFRSDLSFAANSEENDVLVSYEVQLLGNGSTVDVQTAAISGVANNELALSRDVIESTGKQIYIDSYWDPNRRAFWHSLEYDFLEQEYSSYELLITYTTRKGYKAQHAYKLKAAQEGDSETPQVADNTLTNLELDSITATRAPSKGAISLAATLKTPDGADEGFNSTGIFVIERAIDDNAGLTTTNSLKWKTCYEQQVGVTLNITDKTSITIPFDDMTAEPGVFYKYRLKFKAWDEGSQNYKYATSADGEQLYIETNVPTVLFIEDIFLATRDLTLKIRYNPDLTSYKRNVVDIITPTLGGAYPFVRRNGAQRYRTFNLGGLISYNSELYEPSYWNDELQQSIFYESDSIVRTLTTSTGEFDGSLFINYNGKNAINTVKYNTLVDAGNITREEKRLIYEKLFRDMVMNFLYKDHVILFKSQSEGNIFIRLSNVSLTPNKQLGRHIYSFTATATEVLEATNENYLEYFSHSYEDGTDMSLANVYILSGMYEFIDGELYIGAVGTIEEIAEGTLLDTNADSNNYITPSDILQATDPTVEGIERSYQKGAADTYNVDTWGVSVAAEGNIPKVVLKDQATVATVTENIEEFDAFDIHVENPAGEAEEV